MEPASSADQITRLSSTLGENLPTRPTESEQAWILNQDMKSIDKGLADSLKQSENKLSKFLFIMIHETIKNQYRIESSMSDNLWQGQLQISYKFD